MVIKGGEVTYNSEPLIDGFKKTFQGLKWTVPSDIRVITPAPVWHLLHQEVESQNASLKQHFDSQM